jgi:hypothetical protein
MLGEVVELILLLDVIFVFGFIKCNYSSSCPFEKQQKDDSTLDDDDDVLIQSTDSTRVCSIFTSLSRSISRATTSTTLPRINPTIPTIIIDKPTAASLPRLSTTKTLPIPSPSTLPRLSIKRRRTVEMRVDDTYLEKESTGDSIKSSFILCLSKVRSVRKKIVEKTKTLSLPRRKTQQKSTV